MGIDISDIIVGLLALIGTIIGASVTGDKIKALLNYRMDELEKRFDKESSKMETMKEDVTILKRDVKTAFNRIDENRADIKELQKKVAEK